MLPSAGHSTLSTVRGQALLSGLAVLLSQT
jgi:hypothetical protein